MGHRRQDAVFHLRRTQRLETTNSEEHLGNDNANTTLVRAFLNAVIMVEQQLWPVQKEHCHLVHLEHSILILWKCDWGLCVQRLEALPHRKRHCIFLLCKETVFQLGIGFYLEEEEGEWTTPFQHCHYAWVILLAGIWNIYKIGFRKLSGCKLILHIALAVP